MDARLEEGEVGLLTAIAAAAADLPASNSTGPEGAEGVGFEPTRAFTLPVFKCVTSRLDGSPSVPKSLIRQHHAPTHVTFYRRWSRFVPLG